MSISRASMGARRGTLQGILCALGLHAFEEVGARKEVGHRYSEVHETLYEVHREKSLVRCEHCGTERTRPGRVEEIEVGHYDRVFTKGA